MAKLRVLTDDGNAHTFEPTFAHTSKPALDATDYEYWSNRIRELVDATDYVGNIERENHQIDIDIMQYAVFPHLNSYIPELSIDDKIAFYCNQSADDRVLMVHKDCTQFTPELIAEAVGPRYVPVKTIFYAPQVEEHFCGKFDAYQLTINRSEMVTREQYKITWGIE